MIITAKAQGYSKALVETRGHAILCDQPTNNGGEDEGMTPTELLVGALAACGLYYAAQYLKARNLPADALEVSVEAEKAAAPARLGSFRIVLKTAALEERHHEPILRAVKSCVVHNTLTHGPTIEVQLETAPAS